MVSRDLLLNSGRRAYEIGRLRAATRIAWLVAPVVALCALATGAGEACACVGTALVGLAVLLRWRSRREGASVRDGLVAGTLPLVAGLFVTLFPPTWANTSLSSGEALVCATVALLAGAWLGRRLVRGSATLVNWSHAAGVATLVAALGSAGLGLFASASTTLSLLLGSAVAIVPAALVKKTGA